MMFSTINSLGIEYGDALFRIFVIKVDPAKYSDAMHWHSHEYYELHYAQNGKHVYKFEDGSVELTEGKMIIIPPGKKHIADSSIRSDYKPAVLSFTVSKRKDGDNLYNLFNAMLNNASLKPVAMPSSFAEHVLNIKKSISCDDVFGYCYLKKEGAALVESLTCGLKKFLPSDLSASIGRGRDDLLALLDVLVGRNEVSLTEIAKQINYSSRHTSRLIKKIYGATLFEIRKRMNNK